MNYIYNTPVMVVEKQDGPSYSPSSFVNLLEIAICPNPAFGTLATYNARTSCSMPQACMASSFASHGSAGSQIYISIDIGFQIPNHKICPRDGPTPHAHAANMSAQPLVDPRYLWRLEAPRGMQGPQPGQQWEVRSGQLTLGSGRLKDLKVDWHITCHWRGLTKQTPSFFWPGSTNLRSTSHDSAVSTSHVSALQLIPQGSIISIGFHVR